MQYHPEVPRPIRCAPQVLSNPVELRMSPNTDVSGPWTERDKEFDVCTSTTNYNPQKYQVGNLVE